MGPFDRRDFLKISSALSAQRPARLAAVTQATVAPNRTAVHYRWCDGEGNVQSRSLAAGEPVPIAGVAQSQSEGGPLTVAPTGGLAGDWKAESNRTWAGSEFWANRLQDWQVRAGKLECLAAGPNQENRTVHLLTREVLPAAAPMVISVRSGLLESNSGKGWSGFLIGAGAGRLDYRGAAVIHHLSGENGGILAVLAMDGTLAFRDNGDEATRNTYPELAALSTRRPRTLWEDIKLDLEVVPSGSGTYQLRLAAWNYVSGELLGTVSLPGVPSAIVMGSIALVSSPSGEAPGARFWFRDPRTGGPKIRIAPERSFGPVACAMYTVSAGVMKMTAQMMPVDAPQSPRVTLEYRLPGGKWSAPLKTPIVTPGFTAHFRVENWNARFDHEYRLRYAGQTVYSGTIRKDPAAKREIVVAATCCQQVTGRPADDSWGATGYRAPRGRWTKENVWFPHGEVVDGVRAKQPDLLLCLGDQIYESGSPTGRDHQGRFPELDYLYKWYFWCWSLGQIGRDTPLVCLLDDHDIYHGNIWGMGGRRNVTGDDQDGGYLYDPEFVSMAQRTQAAHLPDPYDPTPAANGIPVYYTGFVYGGVSFAVLEDRKFKSPPVALQGIRPGLVKDGKLADPGYDIVSGTGPKLELLGDRQMRFLESWVHDWRGAKLKLAITQTVLASVQTDQNGALVPDLDSNGWPMPARNRAIDLLRRGHVPGVAGDTHLPFVVEHGIDKHGDGIVQFSVPPVANKYRRWFDPAEAGRDPQPGAPGFTGHHVDSFGNKITLHAVANPKVSPREILASGSLAGDQRPTAASSERAQFYSRTEVSYAGVLDWHTILDRTLSPDGFGTIRLNKAAQTISFESWPWIQNGSQHPGWPVTVTLAQCDGRAPVEYLPDLHIRGIADAVVQVIDASTGEIVYTTRAKEGFYRPGVFHKSRYTVRLGEPGTPRMKTIENIQSSTAADRAIDIVL